MMVARNISTKETSISYDLYTVRVGEHNTTINTIKYLRWWSNALLINCYMIRNHLKTSPLSVCNKEELSSNLFLLLKTTCTQMVSINIAAYYNHLWS